MKTSLHLPRTIQTGVIALFVLCAAVIARSLLYAFTDLPQLFLQYLGSALVFLILFIMVMWRHDLPAGLLHAYFVLQAIIIIYLLFLPPHLDFIDVLFVLLSYQVALVFTGRSLWSWCGIFIALILGILIYWMGALFGIAYSMTPIAGCIIFPVYVIANREQELARIQSQKILDQLQEKHHQLELQTSQVEQIAAIEERNRLARELHDSVSQTMFSIILNTRATQILLERDPTRVRPQLVQLQTLTHDALAEMRSLIAQLRPQHE
ncbi:MAG TPA: histidine kinase [Anaerolineales bacterium]|nr:histidine kinase [Anaerolineales bacterium]